MLEKRLCWSPPATIERQAPDLVYTKSHSEASAFGLFQQRWSLRTQVSAKILLLDCGQSTRFKNHRPGA